MRGKSIPIHLREMVVQCNMSDLVFRLCKHVEATVTPGNTTGNVRCGVCKRVWRWNMDKNEFFLIFDPKVDKEEDFDPNRERMVN